MAKAVKRKTPSRVRYEQGHPTVSCRVPRDIYDRLRVTKNTAGKSFVDILKTGLGILEVQAKEEGEVRKKGHAEGYKKGYVEAARLYMVTYPCRICGKTLMVKTEDEKEAIKKYMQEDGWGHSECDERKQ